MLRLPFSLLSACLLLFAVSVTALAEDSAAANDLAAADPVRLSPVSVPPVPELTAPELSFPACELIGLKLRYRPNATAELRDLTLTSTGMSSAGQSYSYDAASFVAESSSPLLLEVEARLPSHDSELITYTNTYTPQHWNGAGADGMSVAASCTAHYSANKCWRLQLTAKPLAGSNSTCKPSSIVIKCNKSDEVVGGDEQVGDTCPKDDLVQVTRDAQRASACGLQGLRLMLPLSLSLSHLCVFFCAAFCFLLSLSV